MLAEARRSCGLLRPEEPEIYRKPPFVAQPTQPWRLQVDETSQDKNSWSSLDGADVPNAGIPISW